MRLPAATLVRVAVDVPLAEDFDYLWPDGAPPPRPGTRVRVPFGRSERVGIVLEHPASTPVATGKLKAIVAALDDEPVIGEELLATLRWAAGYYHHPRGEVLKHALPGLLRRGRPLDDGIKPARRLTAIGRQQDIAALERRAHRQACVLRALRGTPVLTDAALRAAGATPEVLRRLDALGWIEAAEPEPQTPAPDPEPAPVELPELTAEQHRTLTAIEERAAGGYAAFLLYGVTGSGKTEVYLRLIAARMRESRQTLLLVPEIGLTPQLVARLEARFGNRFALMHSALPAGERFDAWRRAARGEAALVVGTRSAVFAPLPNAGLVIVDEEHDASYKQQQGFRYSARDLAVVRARRLGVPIVLASATPALESFHNARAGRYRMLAMPTRVGAAGKPTIRIIDQNRHASRNGLSTPLLAAIEHHLGAGNQVLLFLNRRGFAPVLFCAGCRATEECSRCDARLTVHAGSGRLRCHHCGHERPLQWACQRCGAERIAVGAGTQRVTEQLRALYPDCAIARLDRDATSRRGELARVLSDVQRGDVRILVGTQMLTKGHDFPRVTLVGVLNADQGLFGTDFRADERLAQTILQVAGRAGRRDAPGEVAIQTHYPEHPLLGCLLAQDYAAFADYALAERRAAGWPPFSHLALWRAEASSREAVFRFLRTVRELAASAGGDAVDVLGPAPAAMERRGGRYRGQLLFRCGSRNPLHRLLGVALTRVRARPEARRVRWAIDVDPAEL